MKLQNLCTRLDQDQSFSQRLPLNIEEAKDRLRILMLRKHPRYEWSHLVGIGDCPVGIWDTMPFSCCPVEGTKKELLLFCCLLSCIKKSCHFFSFLHSSHHLSHL